MSWTKRLMPLQMGKWMLWAAAALMVLSVNAQQELVWQTTAKTSTATPNVQLVPEVFTLATLDRQRQIRIYLPPGYIESSERYPVLYMHDGQNVFDAATAFAGEWGVDEALNELAKQGWLKLIVVAVDNGAQHRMTEYSGWDNVRFGKAEGAAYLAFLTQVVKPYVDSHYRTLSAVKHTGIMGSSMGGLISHYALFTWPAAQSEAVFSKAGIYSPSYWYADAVYAETDSQKLAPDSRVALLVGEKEGQDMVSNMHKMASLLRQQGLSPSQLNVKQVADAGHNEAFWRSQFADTALFLFNPAGFYLRRP